MSDCILSLYPSILVPILFEWVCDDDLCCLDSAACNKITRPFLMYCMSKGNVSYSNKKRYHDERYDWILLRGMGLKRCSIQDWEYHLETKSLYSLLNKTKNLDLLEAPACEKLALLIRDLSLRVHSLKLHSTGSNDIVESILHALDKSVVHLDLTDCSKVNNELHPKIPLLCPNLRSYCSPEFEAILPIMSESALINIRFNEVLRMMNVLESVPCKSESYLCTFEKTDVNDESTVLISGSHYSLRSINFQDVLTEKQASILKNLMPNVKSSILVGLLPIESLSVNGAENLRGFRGEFVSGHAFRFATLFTLNSNLRCLILLNCMEVTDEVILALADHCPLLENVYISKLSISETSAKHLFVKCVHLAEVFLSPPTPLNAGLAYLIGGVNSLSLTDVLPGSIALSSLRGLTSLTASSSNMFGSDQEFLNYLSLNPRLMKVTFVRLDQVNDVTVKALVELCPLLTSISISQCKTTSCCLLDLAECLQLTELSLQYFDVMKEHAERFFQKQRTSLIKLVLLSCSVTDEILDLIVRYCQVLRNLNVGHNNKISSAGVIELLKSPALTYLDLQRCKGVTRQIFPALAKKRRMRFLNLTQTNMKRLSVLHFHVDSGFSCSISLVY